MLIEYSDKYYLTDLLSKNNRKEIIGAINFKKLLNIISAITDSRNQSNGLFQEIVFLSFGGRLELPNLKEELVNAIMQKWQEGVRPLAYEYYTKVALLLLCYHKHSKPENNCVKVNAKPLLSNILFFATGAGFNPQQNYRHLSYYSPTSLSILDHIFNAIKLPECQITKEIYNNINQGDNEKENGSTINNETKKERCCIC